TLLWSPHGHPEVIDELLPLAQAVLIDSVEEPDHAEALDRAAELSEQAYVVDLAWLRSTPWRERVAALFDPPSQRPELRLLSALTARPPPPSPAAAALLVGWPSSRLGWQTPRLVSHNGELAGKAHASRQDVNLRLQVAPELQVPGLEGLTIETAGGEM